jgi:KDO2-lipid IV(A) lauroyltransferase
LTLAFPEKSSGEIEALIREIWGNVGAVMAEYPHLPAYTVPENPQRLEIVNTSDSQAFQGNANPAIFVSAHLANWELPAAALSRLGVQGSVLYTRCRTPG